MSCVELPEGFDYLVTWGRQPAVLTWLVIGIPLFPVRRVRRRARCGDSLP